MEKKGNKSYESILCSRKLSFTVLAAALIYNIIFGFMRNPVAVENTLSWIGYDYPYAFIMWGIFTSAAFFLNIYQIYEKFGYRGKIGLFSLYSAPFSVVTLVLINDWGWESRVHLAAALAFIVLNGTAVMVLPAKNYKKHICYRVTLFVVLVILLGMLITYFAIDKSGLLELVPLWGELVLLFLINHTEIYPVPEKKEEDREYKDTDSRKAAKLALLLGIFGADDFYLGRYPQGTFHLLMTFTGILVCIVRFIGMGSINNISGESASVYLAVGLSLFGSSAGWAVYNGLSLKSANK